MTLNDNGSLAGDTLQVVVFSLVDDETNRREDYAVEIEQVQEIRALESITRVPNAPSHVRGIMNLRGKIISVIDLKKKLDFPTNGEINGKSRILVAEVGNSLIGLLVDEVDQVMRIPTRNVETNAAGGLENLQYVKGVAKAHNKLIVLLDIPKLLNNDDMQHRAKGRK